MKLREFSEIFDKEFFFNFITCLSRDFEISEQEVIGRLSILGAVVIQDFVDSMLDKKSDEQILEMIKKILDGEIKISFKDFYSIN